MAIKNTSFAKGDAVQKLIEVIARVNNKSVAGDAALQSAIDEVREIFKTDELTEYTTAELNALISGSQLEPGHKYKITDNDNIIVSAKSTSELESYAIGDAGIYEYSTVSGFSLIPEHLTKVEFNNFTHNVAEGDTYTPLQKIILETVGTDDFIGSNSVTTVANIPVTKSTVVATVATGGAVSFAEGLAEGREVYVIAQNSGTEAITLTFTDANVESVELAAGARAEFSVINIAGTYYVRVGVDAAAVEEISAEEVAAKFA